jgi:putative spermidine/putrescine transport system permease protein
MMEVIGADRGLMKGVVIALACTVLVFLMAPIFVVLPVSVTDQRFLSFPQETISFKHFADVLTRPDWRGAIWQSLVIATTAAALDVVIGTLCAVGCWRLASRSSETVRTLMLAPIIIPSIVYTLGIYRLYVDLNLIDSFLGIMLAHMVTGIPYPVITVSASLAGFDIRLEQAARVLGATLPQTTWRVIVPNIMPGILSGAIFSFIHSWDETVMVLFIAGRTAFTLPRRMWDDINENVDPSVASVAVLLIGVTLALLFAEMALRKRRNRA